MFCELFDEKEERNKKRLGKLQLQLNDLLLLHIEAVEKGSNIFQAPLYLV